VKNHGENEARKIWRRYEGRSWKNIGENMGRFGENPGKNTGNALGCMGKICDFLSNARRWGKV
jgi:hypothetical protein